MTAAPAAPAASAPTEAAAPQGEAVLRKITVRASTERQGKDDYQATETRIGKGKQDIRDIPQSLTVVTEKVMDDRKMDSVKDVLRNTAGISFQAAEGGEEDIKIHGISLQSTGDIFIDGMRDPAFYDRDTFFLDRIELLRGSASLLFGRGSTGGAVNQVLKPARLLDENQIDVTAGSYSALRVVGDFNKRTGENSALRVGVMGNTADSNGAGSSIDKKGIAGTYRWGIDEQDEFSATLFALQNDNGINYGVRWIRPTTALANTNTPAAAATSTLVPLDPNNYYGLSSDYNRGSANFGMLSHTRRFTPGVELVSKVRYAEYTRDQRATLWSFGAGTLQPGGQTVSLETLSPSTVVTRGLQIKKQNMQTLTAQSDLSAKFKGLGLDHYLQTGVDFAHEKKQVCAAIPATQGGIVPAKPSTTIGTPYDGASIDEGQRSFRPNNDYVSKSAGAYVQDMVQLAPMWKLLAGLRYDYLVGNYNQYATASPTAVNPLTVAPYQMKVSEWSKRGAVLFQPDAQWSFHLMGATSFNTSGDAYSLSAANKDIPPEQTVNVELGAKFDTADGKLSLRGGLFRNTKLHERNTDPLSSVVTLSGKRHAAGLDVDMLGRITPQWEVFANFTWMPIAMIDVSSATGGERQGQRPSLSPKVSGTLWTTYQVHPQWRIGGGLNARSSQTPNRNPGFAAPGFIKGDLMAEFTMVPETLTFRLNVDNVTNKRYADQLYTSFYVPGPGRVVSLTGSYKF
ncbi:MAG: TonB-dependent receptor [Burkholderiales bacterium]